MPKAIKRKPGHLPAIRTHIKLWKEDQIDGHVGPRFFFDVVTDNDIEEETNEGVISGSFPTAEDAEAAAHEYMKDMRKTERLGVFTGVVREWE